MVLPRPLTLVRELLRNLASRPVTRPYGAGERPSPEPGYRGLHRVDESKCIGCRLCAIECPTGAITMVERGGRRLPVIDYGLCIFCYHCVDVCPRKAYVATRTPPPPVERREDLVGDRAWERAAQLQWLS